MRSKQHYGSFFIAKRRRAISLVLSTIVLLSITSITTTLFVNNGNVALAQSSQSQQQNQLPSSTSSSSSLSQQPKITHEYTLVAENTTLEIAPGLRVDAWTYNGTVPGPTITATEGDRVIIHFINKTPLPHTIHLHGDHPSQEDGVFEMVPPNGIYTLKKINNIRG
jgi:nitrite reductase (NO-forming)